VRHPTQCPIMQRTSFFLFLLTLVISSLPIHGQLSSIHGFLKDDTLLRKNYYQQSVKKKELLLGSLSKEKLKEYKDIYDEQFTEISNLWKSSRPVTAPEAHAYLQSLVTKIIAVNPELKGTDARVVFSRDWWPNAVSMGDGTIAINAGLVMHMNNEAELVFVVCHELSHYYLEHSQKAITKYVETINSESFQAELKRLSKTAYGANQQLEQMAKSVAFNSRRHSRDNEAAADRQAFLFMKNTGYDCNAIKTCLELLDKVDDSLFYKPISPEQSFHFPDYPFRTKWIRKETGIFSEITDNSSFTQKEKDSLKTHPDCSKRILLLKDSIQQLPAGKKFIVDEKTFNGLRKGFFKEIMEECYRGNDLSRNLYFSLLLLEEAENKQLAIYSIVRCLNTLYDKQKNHTLGLAIDKENKNYPDDYNQLLRMLDKIRLDELAQVSYYFCRQHMQEMKEYPGFKEEMQKAIKNKDL